jgi:hypothetical protein
MPNVFVSSVVNAPAEKVWETIRRFDAVAEWLPFVKSSPIEDGGDPTRVGCVRVLTQTDGEVESVNNRIREISGDPGRARPASAVDGLRRGERSRLTNHAFEFLPGLLQICYLPEIEPSRKICF